MTVQTPAPAYVHDRKSSSSSSSPALSIRLDSHPLSRATTRDVSTPLAVTFVSLPLPAPIQTNQKPRTTLSSLQGVRASSQRVARFRRNLILASIALALVLVAIIVLVVLLSQAIHTDVRRHFLVVYVVGVLCAGVVAAAMVAIAVFGYRRWHAAEHDLDDAWKVEAWADDAETIHGGDDKQCAYRVWRPRGAPQQA